MENNKKISVIVPIYNSENQLNNCISSILNNTYKNIELICINDGSTDKSLNIIKQFSQKDSRIKIIDKKNEGVSSARNAGLNIATGDYIVFIDSDDYVHPRYFEALMETQSKTDSDMVVCGFIRTNKYCNNFENYKINELETVDSATIEKIVSHPTNVYIWGKLYRLNIIGNIRFDDKIKFAEDTLFNYSVLINCNKFSIIEKNMYYYFDTENSLSKNWSSDELLPVIEALLNLYYKNNKNKKIKFVFVEYLNKLLAYRYLTMYSNENRKIIKEFINSAKKELKIIPKLTKYQKLKYFLFLEFSSIYRLVRIISDPTLIDWEKSQKKELEIKRD